MSEGKKYDQGKLRYDLLPTEAIEEVVRVLTEGAKKYGDRNWENGIQFSRLLAASRRHEAAFLKGELRDPETHTVHLANDIVNKLMMLQFVLTGGSERLDDLPHSSKRHTEVEVTSKAKNFYKMILYNNDSEGEPRSGAV